MQAASSLLSPGLHLLQNQTSDPAPQAAKEWKLSWWKGREANFTRIELHHPMGAGYGQDAQDAVSMD